MSGLRDQFLWVVMRLTIIMLLNLTFTIKQLFLLGFSYPSHQQYSDIVRAIFNRWPHLQQKLSNSQDAMEIYRSWMRTYFKNAWKLFSTAIPEVLAKRTIFGKRKTRMVMVCQWSREEECLGGWKIIYYRIRLEKMPVLWMHTENDSISSITSQVQRETNE